MLVIINKLTYYLLERKAVCKPATTRREDRNNANDSFGKGFDVLKDHVLNRLMTGRCPRIVLQLRPKFHSLFLQNSLDCQKSATFKALKSSPRTYTDVSFTPENGAFSRMEKRVSEWVSDRQSDYCNPLAHARWGLINITLIIHDIQDWPIVAALSIWLQKLRLWNCGQTRC